MRQTDVYVMPGTGHEAGEMPDESLDCTSSEKEQVRRDSQTPYLMVSRVSGSFSGWQELFVVVWLLTMV